MRFESMPHRNAYLQQVAAQAQLIDAQIVFFYHVLHLRTHKHRESYHITSIFDW